MLGPRKRLEETRRGVIASTTTRRVFQNGDYQITYTIFLSLLIVLVVLSLTLPTLVLSLSLIEWPNPTRTTIIVGTMF
jgi:hypothetical protein